MIYPLFGTVIVFYYALLSGCTRFVLGPYMFYGYLNEKMNDDDDDDDDVIC